jgi:hypothetical protein
MQLVTRPKLLPPLALLWQGPNPGPAGHAAPLNGAAPAHRPTLTGQELRRIVADLIG